MLFTFLRDLPARVEGRLFPSLRGPGASLPHDATDADIAAAVWRPLRAEAIQFGEGPSARKLLPACLTVHLPIDVFNTYAGRDLLGLLAEAVSKRLAASAGAEGYVFAEDELALSWSPGSSAAPKISVAWPAQKAPALSTPGPQAEAAPRTLLVREATARGESTLRSSLFVVDVIDAKGGPVVRHWISLGATTIAFNVEGTPDTSPVRTHARLRIPGPGSREPQWLAPAPDWGPVRWTRCAPDPSRLAACGRGLERLLDPGHTSWTTGNNTERLVATRDVALTLGRNEAMNDIALTDDAGITATAHLLLAAEPDGSLSGVDLGSSNGTQRNGSPLAPLQPIPLHVGDVLTVGTTLLRFARA